MFTVSSVLAVRKFPGTSTTARACYSTASMHDLISIKSRETVGDIASILFDPSCCFWLYEHHRVLMKKSRFSFKNSRCSRAVVFSSSVIWYGSIDNNDSLMCNYFIYFHTALSTDFPQFFGGRCPHDILWKIGNHLPKVVNIGHQNLPAMDKLSSMSR